MKRYILAIAAMAVIVASCGRKVDYEYICYATFETSLHSFDEDAGEVTVPVTIYNPSGKEVSVSVETINGKKGKESVDFNVISPMSGVITFAPGETTKDIVVEIIDFPKQLTGTKDFYLELSSATEGFSVGGVSKTTVKIKDLDHPLKKFIGVWSASTKGSAQGYSYSWDIVIEGDLADDPDWSVVNIYDLDPFAANYLGLSSALGYNEVEAVGDDLDNPSKLTIADDSYIGPYSINGAECSITLRGLDSPSSSLAKYYTDMTIELNGDGTLTIPNAWCTYVSLGAYYETFEGGIVLTKK